MKKVTFALLLVTLSNVAKADLISSANSVDVSSGGLCYGLTGALVLFSERVDNKNEETLRTIKRLTNINEMFFTIFQKELQSGVVSDKVGAASLDYGMNLVTKEGPSGPEVLKNFANCLTALQKAKESGLVK